MDFGSIALLGIDVGFSKKRKTTGLAWAVGGDISAARTGTAWETRRACLPSDVTFGLAAIDAPVLPQGAPPLMPRRCERLFGLGAFQKRCKPGHSHHGFGLALRDAGAATARDVRAALHRAGSFGGPRVVEDWPIVEAFPNAFIGVLLGDWSFASAPIRRGKKFDLLYEQALAERSFEQLLDRIGWASAPLVGRLAAERDHERQAALICLMTAACAASGLAAFEGDEAGGYFCLPPKDIWADWAVDALEASKAMG